MDRSRIVKRGRVRKMGFSGVAVTALVSGLCLAACTVTDTIYLRQLETATPVSQPPLHLNADDRETWVHLTPRVTYSPTRLMTGDIEGSGPYKATGKNLKWNMPAAAFAVDVDCRVARLLAITCGVNFANIHSESFVGGNAGLGLLFGGEDMAGRFDAGLHFQKVLYEAASVVVTEFRPWFSSSSTTTVGFFLDEGSSGTTAIYVALTLNTKGAASPVNGYLQLALGVQNVADFHPGEQVFVAPYLEHVTTDARLQSSSTYVMLSPGLYFNLSEGLRLLAGVRLAWETEIGDPSPGMLVLPMIQCEISL